jgi:branched-subunit amino acid aminotransferase/4-amino-4-deoxychorismate lyase
MRAQKGRVIYLRKHLERMASSSQALKIKVPYSLVKLKEIILKAIKLSGLRDAYLRLTLWQEDKESKILLIVRQYKAFTKERYKQGLKACISKYIQSQNSPLPYLKTTNRLLYQFALKEAKDKGFDEAVFLNTSGHLTEGTRSNLFFVQGDTLVTPSLECGCLAGITRRAVIDIAAKSKIKLEEGNFTVQDLYNAKEAFLTNSLIGLMPLVNLEGHLIAKGRPGELTIFLMQKYNSLLKNAG